jgi:hypothetical protein
MVGYSLAIRQEFVHCLIKNRELQAYEWPLALQATRNELIYSLGQLKSDIAGHNHHHQMHRMGTDYNAHIFNAKLGLISAAHKSYGKLGYWA